MPQSREKGEREGDSTRQRNSGGEGEGVQVQSDARELPGLPYAEGGAATRGGEVVRLLTIGTTLVEEDHCRTNPRGQRGTLAKFVKIFYEPTGYLASFLIVAGRVKDVAWPTFLNPTKIALLCVRQPRMLKTMVSARAGIASMNATIQAFRTMASQSGMRQNASHLA